MVGTITQITGLYQASGSAVFLEPALSLPKGPRSFPVYASIVSFGFRLLYNCNTRYEWLVRPCSPGTFTLQEAPSFAWRTNGLRSRSTLWVAACGFDTAQPTGAGVDCSSPGWPQPNRWKKFGCVDIAFKCPIHRFIRPAIPDLVHARVTT